MGSNSPLEKPQLEVVVINSAADDCSEVEVGLEQLGYVQQFSRVRDVHPTSVI